MNKSFWFRADRCPYCKSQMMTNGRDGWCSRCDYTCRYIWVDGTEYETHYRRGDKNK